MKRKPMERMITALAVFGLALLSGCGKSDSGGTSGVGGTNLPILPTSGGCVPITAPIGLSGTNVRFDWANIIAGQLPNSGQSIGQLAITGSIQGQNLQGGPYQRNGVDGTISLNIQSAQQYNQNPQYPNTTVGTDVANMTGFVSISSMTQQDIAYRVQRGEIPIGLGGQTYNPNYPSGVPNVNLTQQICVSAVAMNLGHYYYTIYGGHVYLYLNNTQHGYILYF